MVLERHASFGRETSSRNSEVVHAGLYYPTGSIRAELCVRAVGRLYEWCESRGVPIRKVGKFIVAVTRDEEPGLEALLAKAHANGATGVRRVTLAELAEAEPDVRVVAALWSPASGIIDSHAFMQRLADEADEAGTDFAFGHQVRTVEQGNGYRLTFDGPDGERGTIESNIVVNAAGLDADRVAELTGIDLDDAGYRLQFVKGSYFRVAPSAVIHPRHLIYPMPTPGLTGLGVHVTVDLAGGVRLGPDVEFLEERVQDYRVDPAKRGAFHQAVSRYLPALRQDDLSPDHSGIRPRRVMPVGATPDFVVEEESARGLPGWVNLIGMESPALTCAVELGERVVELIDGRR